MKSFIPFLNSNAELRLGMQRNQPPLARRVLTRMQAWKDGISDMFHRRRGNDSSCLIERYQNKHPSSLFGTLDEVENIVGLFSSLVDAAQCEEDVNGDAFIDLAQTCDRMNKDISNFFMKMSNSKELLRAVIISEILYRALEKYNQLLGGDFSNLNVREDGHVVDVRSNIHKNDSRDVARVDREDEVYSDSYLHDSSSNQPFVVLRNSSIHSNETVELDVWYDENSDDDGDDECVEKRVFVSKKRQRKKRSQMRRKEEEENKEENGNDDDRKERDSDDDDSNDDDVDKYQEGEEHTKKIVSKKSSSGVKRREDMKRSIKALNKKKEIKKKNILINLDDERDSDDNCNLMERKDTSFKLLAERYTSTKNGKKKVCKATKKKVSKDPKLRSMDSSQMNPNPVTPTGTTMMMMPPPPNPYYMYQSMNGMGMAPSIMAPPMMMSTNGGGAMPTLVDVQDQSRATYTYAQVDRVPSSPASTFAAAASPLPPPPPHAATATVAVPVQQQHQLETQASQEAQQHHAAMYQNAMQQAAAAYHLAANAYRSVQGTPVSTPHAQSQAQAPTLMHDGSAASSSSSKAGGVSAHEDED